MQLQVDPQCRFTYRHSYNILFLYFGCAKAFRVVVLAFEVVIGAIAWVGAMAFAKETEFDYHSYFVFHSLFVVNVPISVAALLK